MANARIALPTLSGGVSTQAPALRHANQVTSADNALITVKDGMDLRPGTMMGFALSGPVSSGTYRLHVIKRDASERYLVVYGRDASAGNIRVYTPTGGTPYINISAAAQTYLNLNSATASQLRLITIADYTLVLNTTVPVTASDADVYTVAGGHRDYDVMASHTPANNTYHKTKESTAAEVKGYYKYSLDSGSFPTWHRAAASYGSDQTYFEAASRNPGGFKVGCDRVDMDLTGATLGETLVLTLYITKTNAFLDYEWQSGDYIYISGGTNAVVGWHEVLSRTNGNTIVLAAGCYTGGPNTSVNNATTSGIGKEFAVTANMLDSTIADMHDVALQFQEAFQAAGATDGLIEWGSTGAARTGYFVITGPWRGTGLAVHDPTAPASGFNHSAAGEAFKTTSTTVIEGTGGPYPHPDESIAVKDRWEKVSKSGDADAVIDAATMPLKMIRVNAAEKDACRLATTAALAACTYDNGTSGVHATLTADANGALGTIDSVTAAVADRVLVKDQASAPQNGIYTVVSVGSASTKWKLRRVSDFDEANVDEIAPHAFADITLGTVNTGKKFRMSTTGAITVGTTNLAWTDITGSDDPIVFDVDAIDWVNRLSGDFATNPVLSLWEKETELNDITFHRNRLWLVGGENAVASQAGDFFNFWIEDDENIADADPIDAALNAERVTVIDYAIPFRKTLVLLTKSGVQFELNAPETLTMNTAAITPTTMYNSLSARPDTIGLKLYFAATKEGTTQLYEYYYSDSAAAVDAADVSQHALGYLPATIQTIRAAANDNAVLLLPSAGSNIYILRSFWDGPDRKQAAWARYTFSSLDVIQDIGVLDNRCYMLVKNTLAGPTYGFFISYFTLPQEDAASGWALPVRMDNRVTNAGAQVESDGNYQYEFTLAIPDPSLTHVVLGPAHGAYEGASLALTKDSDTAYHTAWSTTNYGTGASVLGRVYTMSAELTRPYIRERDGSSVLDCELQLVKLVTNHRNSGPYTIRITQPLSRQRDTTFTPSGSVETEGKLQAYLLGNTKDATVSIRASGPKPVSIATGEWQVTYNTLSR